MVWYDTSTNEVVDDCNVCEYIEKIYTEQDHREYLKSVGICPDSLSKTDFRCSYVEELDASEWDIRNNHDLASNYGLGWAEYRCDVCGEMFEDESELDEDGIEDEITYLCPNCGYSGHIVEFGKRFSKYLQKPI